MLFRGPVLVIVKVSYTEYKFACKPSGVPVRIRITTTNHIRGMVSVPGDI
jgi:hypothetical protein